MSQKIKIYCNTCKRPTDHDVIEEHFDSLKEAIDPDSSDLNYPDMMAVKGNQSQILKCSGCKSISFRKLIINHDYETGGYKEVSSTIKLYPAREENYFKSNTLIRNKKVRNVYFETINSFNSNNYLLTALGLRTTVEAVCLDKKIKGKNIFINGETKYKNDLEIKINMLAERKHITQDQANILHGLRFMGNDATHKIKTPSKKELVIALEIIDHLLKSIYELGKKARQMKVYPQVRKMKKKQYVK